MSAQVLLQAIEQFSPEQLLLFAGASLVAFIVATAFVRKLARGRYLRRILRTSDQLTELATNHFLAQPCSRCHESTMRLVSVSPNARSLAYQCVHCEKNMRATAATDDAARASTIFDHFEELCSRWDSGSDDPSFEVIFETAAAPLPFEQTTRSPIPEAVRSEVWRRDQGCCVQCGISQNLEFDHIIPLARGGATSVRNVQLLCRSCNASKGDSI